nr:MAG: ataxin 2 SM domain protein [Bacteriophage sp.]
MKLRAYEGKRVTVITSDGKKYSGVVRDYIFPEDNEPEGIESIILDGELEITGPEIVAIK